MKTELWGASWSGGKDSCLACWEALQAGLEVRWLVNFTSRTYGRVRFHGVKDELVALQARAVGLELYQCATADGDGYEKGFRASVEELKSRGMTGMVFGDISLDEHKEWVETTCGDLGIEAREPLWGRGEEQALMRFVQAGFKAVVVSAQAEHFGPEFVGRAVDEELLAELRQMADIRVCGEMGEYHTFVYDGPLFQRPVALRATKPVRKDTHWFLNIYDYALGTRTGRQAPGTG